MDPTLYANVVLSNPQNGTLDPNNYQGTVAIYDTDGPPPTVQFSSANFSVSIATQSPNTANITVTMSGPWWTPVTVNYASSPGSATSAQDYSDVSGQLTFSPWQTSQSFTVQVYDTNLPGLSKTVSLTLSNVNGAQAGNPMGATLTITDTAPNVAFSQSPVYVFEAGAPLVTIATTSPTSRAVRVSYKTTEDIAGQSPIAQLSYGSPGSDGTCQVQVTGVVTGTTTMYALYKGAVVGSVTTYVVQVDYSEDCTFVLQGQSATVSVTITPQAAASAVGFDTADTSVATCSVSGQQISVTGVGFGPSTVRDWLAGNLGNPLPVYVAQNLANQDNVTYQPVIAGVQPTLTRVLYTGSDATGKIDVYTDVRANDKDGNDTGNSYIYIRFSDLTTDYVGKKQVDFIQFVQREYWTQGNNGLVELAGDTTNNYYKSNKLDGYQFYPYQTWHIDSQKHTDPYMLSSGCMGSMSVLSYTIGVFDDPDMVSGLDATPRQVFTAITYVIVDGNVIAEVDWGRASDVSDGQPNPYRNQYTAVTITPTNAFDDNALKDGGGYFDSYTARLPGLALDPNSKVKFVNPIQGK